MPSAWGRYSPTFWDFGTFVGTIGLFLTLMFLFVRGLPAIAISEMRELVAHEGQSKGNAHDGIIAPFYTALWASSKRRNIACRGEKSARSWL